MKIFFNELIICYVTNRGLEILGRRGCQVNNEH